MGARKWRDIAIRGVVYPTAQAAAAALGVQAQTVMIAARNGQAALDRVGLGQRHPCPMPVQIGGRAFASAGQAAQALGVDRGAIYRAIEAGTPDRVLQPRRRPPCLVRARPVVLCGRSFASAADVDRLIGKNHGYTALCLRRGTRGALAILRQRVLAALMAEDAVRVRARQLVAA